MPYFGLLICEHVVAKLVAEQVVGREPRERVSHEAFVNQSWRWRAARVNSGVRLLSLVNLIIVLWTSASSVKSLEA
jgi:hypothetical protein